MPQRGKTIEVINPGIPGIKDIDYLNGCEKFKQLITKNLSTFLLLAT